MLGAETFEEMLPEILAGCSNAAPHVREGHLTLLRFLPLALGQIFEAHLKEALAEVLSGLADAVEPVRDAALGAGRVFVEEFGHSGPSLDLLLPSIEDGIAPPRIGAFVNPRRTPRLDDVPHRRRDGKVRVEGGSDDEGISTEAQGRALTAALGERAPPRSPRRRLCAPQRRHSGGAPGGDSHLEDRGGKHPANLASHPAPAHAASHRGSQRGERRRATDGGRCLGELVRKLGERVLPRCSPSSATASPRTPPPLARASV